jgi:SAM-dependent methyltransferase
VDWRTKARLQKVLSALPSGYRLNYLLQRYVTRSLPRPEAELRQIIATAERHLAAVSAHLDKPIREARFFEFGAGYDLAEPLCASTMGVTDRLLYDIRPIARVSVVLRTAEALRELGIDVPGSVHDPRLDEYLASSSLRYVAPGDARATGLAPASIDACTTTSVLEHIAPDDLISILAELRRILIPGGVCSFAIDYHDHFAGADSSIDGLHFLRYTDDEWKKWNSNLQFQNRLRHDDYVELFRSAGFELTVIDAVVDPSFPDDPVVSDRFAGRADLSFGDGWFVLKNPRS